MQLDEHLFARALGVLDQEQPTPRQLLLFRLLGLCVVAALVLLLLFLFVRISHPTELVGTLIARTAAVLFLLNIPMVVLNWSFVAKLWRAAKLRRSLTSTWQARLRAQFKARRGRNRLANAALFIFGAVVGLPAMLSGLIATLLELQTEGWTMGGISLAVALTAFGISCISLYFIARGREQLAAVTELRAALLAGRTDGNEAVLDIDQYDDIVRMERGQISDSRQRSIEGVSHKRSQLRFSTRESRAVHTAMLALSPQALRQVQDCIDQLTSNPHAGEPGPADRDDRSIDVAGTTLRLGFIVDDENREIKLLQLENVANVERGPAR